MSSDSDNDVGSAGESPAPGSADNMAGKEAVPGKEPVQGRKAFRGWTTARGEDGESSVIHRVRESIASLFTAKETPVTPPGDFKFPWAKQDIDLSATRAEESPLSGNVARSEDDLAIEEAFASMDEALPASNDDVVPPEFADTLPGETKRPSFIGRLFSSEPDEAPRRLSLEIEIHQERIDRAAGVLDSGGTLEFQPAADITLYGDTSRNLDMVARAAALDGKTDEFEVSTAPMGEQPAQLSGGRQMWTALLARLAFWRKKQRVDTVASSSATVVEGNPVFLYAKFRAFYNEIIRFKHQKSEYTAGFSTAIMSEVEAQLTEPNTAAESLGKKLIELLELQAAEAKWMGGEMGARYPEAQFAMAALADETFEQTEWEGQSAWPNHRLEMQLYHTHGAAFEVFKRIDRLLKDAPNTPVARDMARVYLLVLSAGFQGKYRQFGLTRALTEYRQRLYEFIYHDDALMLYAPDRKLFPDAAARTREGHAVSRFSAAQRWAAILAFVIVSYAVVAHVAWSRVSADLQDVTSRIITDSLAERGTR